MKLYQLTDFPKVYQHQFWGSLSHNKSLGTIVEVVEARNNFAKTWPGLKGLISDTIPKYVAEKVDRKLSSYFDHIEFYKFDKSYIIVHSPYYSHYNEHALTEEMHRLGWEMIPKMFNQNTLSFMMVVKR